jgi:hypothetical protein
LDADPPDQGVKFARRNTVIEEFAGSARRGPTFARVDGFWLEEADETALSEIGGANGFIVAPDA